MKEIRKIIYKEHDPYMHVNMFPEEMQGWDSTSPAFLDVIDRFQPKLIVEVGTWKGGSAIHMAELLKERTTNFEIVCVDTWLGSVEHWDETSAGLGWHDDLEMGRPTIYQQFMSNIIHKGLTDYITPFPIDSINAAEFFKRKKIKPDMVYIDAGHEYMSVKHDLFAYADVVRDGGIILGDDWFHEPIQRAAIELFTEEKIHTLTSNKFLWIK